MSGIILLESVVDEMPMLWSGGCWVCDCYEWVFWFLWSVEEISVSSRERGGMW